MTGYWERPQDITKSWATLRTKFEQQAYGHGGSYMRIGVLVSKKMVTAVLDASYLTAEPRQNGNGPPTKEWWAVIRRLRSVAPDGVAMITTSVLLDARGQPVRWETPVCRALDHL